MANTYKFKGTGMGVTNYFLDTFVAHKMSEITMCGAPDMESEEKKWLNSFVLRTALNVKIEPKSKAHLLNFIRRIEASFSSYREARKSLI